MIEMIQNLTGSGLITTGIASVVSLILGYLIKKHPTKVAKANIALGEVGELLVLGATAVADGKITKSELKKLGKEGKDTYKALKDLTGK